MRATILIGFITLIFISCNSNKDTNEISNNESSANTPFINYTVTNLYPHDTTSFTEGFLMHDGKLYESTGAPNGLPKTKSQFGVVNLKTGSIETKVELDKTKYFGEGIVFLNAKVYQLTYQTKIGFIYDANTFKKLGEFTFPTKEGWGITTDSSSLIMSDGTNTITYLDPNGFKPIKTLAVTDENGPVNNVNELEYINGFIYANVYTTNTIIKIDSHSGKVIGKLDLSSLATDAKIKNPASLEMNGIAYDPTTHKVYITGKMWPNIYEISFNQ
jgi:glutaminyl-peptide cyclotransferase